MWRTCNVIVGGRGGCKPRAACAPRNMDVVYDCDGGGGSCLGGCAGGGDDLFVRYSGWDGDGSASSAHL